MLKQVVGYTIAAGFFGLATFWMVQVDRNTVDGHALTSPAGECSVTQVETVQKGGARLEPAYRCR